MTDLGQRVLQGERRAAARLMRLLDDSNPTALETLREIYPHTGNAYILGITGSPGSGKSTLTNQLIRAYREAGQTVGVVAIDPTSPFSGGAILGDRIRMLDHEADPGVFVRSLATRGNLGGLSRSTRDVIQVLDAMGKDVIIIETVGVGQDEIDIVGTAHTSLVVLVPGMGDDIQAIKAGILEIADLFVLNKADRQGADRTEREIRSMIELGKRSDQSWVPPVVRTVAIQGQGVDDVLDAVRAHRDEIAASGELQTRMARGRSLAFWELLQYRFGIYAREAIADDAELSALMDELKSGNVDPYSGVQQVLDRLLD